MTGDSENNMNVIAQDDPLFTEHPHFDFEVLRREGLAHIGELSGKIWTDHNAHDPGVTILETLCYALVDLGYRTTLPMEDLLAGPPVSAADSNPAIKTKQDRHKSDHRNFFTPHEILSCNPTTVLDFRKLLLNIDGVHNAWLETVDYNLCADPIAPNGLYRVLIQKEAGWKDEALILKPVFEALAAHRNLCEDFRDVTLLESADIGVCADIEIAVSADPSTVYEGIIKACRTYITPEINYYTLQELLDKGRDIEAIFAGRPLLLDGQDQLRNAGFIDTDELEALPFRTALYYSDLYSALLAVEGVVAIHKLAVQPDKKNRDAISEGSGTAPCIKINEGYAAEFSLPQTCITLQTARGRLSLDKEGIHQRLLNSGKPCYGAEYLDRNIPQGQYRPGLADYYSIQHDFPGVYGIGDGGLADDEPLLRKVQAMQLKGYLLFYDQLLANYLAQMANLRHLFSLQAESERADTEKHSYFSQALNNVPEWEKLLPRHPGRALNNGSILAIPVQDNERLAQALAELPAYPLKALWVTDSCSGEAGEIPHLALISQAQREAHIRQSIRDFQQGHYTIELAHDRNGYLFTLRPQQDCEWLLLSYPRYNSADEARTAANFTAFLASRPEYYACKRQSVVLETGAKQLQYQYNVAYDPKAYAAYLQFLVEDETLYLQRREAFLDHLLARFAARFTDYTLLRFGEEVTGVKERRQTVEDKSRFLSQVDRLSRDRGRAYDYLKPSWGTDNVSGFEQRVSLLAGMQQPGRRHLSKFEVLERFRIEVNDPEGKAWFSSIATYASREELCIAQKDLLEDLADPALYPMLCKRLRGFDPDAVARLFSQVANDENIEVCTYVYSLLLKDSQGKVRREITSNHDNEFGNKYYLSESKLLQYGVPKLVKSSPDSDMRLVELGTNSRLYFDQQQLQFRIEPIISYKWHRYHTGGELFDSAETAYPSQLSAIQDFVKTGEHQDIIFSKTTAFRWSLTFDDEIPALLSIHAFAKKEEAESAWRRCRHDAQNANCYQQMTEPDGQGTTVILTTAGGFELACASVPETMGPDVYIQRCQAEFAKDARQPAFSVLSKAYGWQLTQQDANAADASGEPLLQSTLLYRDMPGALFGLMEAMSAAQDDKNFCEEGSAFSLDYRALLRSTNGAFIATTENFDDANACKENLDKVRKQLKQQQPLLAVREEPRLYRWAFYQTEDGEVILSAKQGEVFSSKAAAKTDFERAVLSVYEEQADSPIVQQLYRAEINPIPQQYKFIYYLNDAEGKAAPLFKSKKAFDSKLQAEKKYKDFVAALAEMKDKKTEDHKTQFCQDKVQPDEADSYSAVLIEETAINCTKASCLLKYMQEQHDGSVVDQAQSKWIYRLLDRDHPIAQSIESYLDCQSAREAKKTLCGYNPGTLRPKQEVLRIICPQQSAKRYHYALFLGSKDKEGIETATLISHVGYDNEKAALEAGEENWLELIEKAADSQNYGEGKLIAVTETYAPSTGSACDQFGGYRAVKPNAIDIEEAVALAGDYPIRITYEEDEDTESKKRAVGFHFQVYSRDSTGREYPLWWSTLDYQEFDQVFEAYQQFVTLLGNPDGCRIECEDGGYRLHLIEILAESCEEFCQKTEAWGEVETRNASNTSCANDRLTGVRLLAEVAGAETAYVPVCDRGGYRFEVMAKGYERRRLAIHPYNHPDRDRAQQAEQRARNCIQDEGMHLVEHLLLRPPAGCKCLLPVCPDEHCTLTWEEDADPDTNKEAIKHTYIPGTDPYSFWATIVLPGWVERFRQEERRKVFRQMLHREAPALVGLNIVWLNPQQMHDFESVFKGWLNSRRYPSALCDKNYDPFCDMVNCIKGLESDPACTDPDAAGADGDDCLPGGDNVLDDSGIEEVDNLFWLECPTESKPAGMAAINRVMNERKEKYKKRFSDLGDTEAKRTGSYDQVSIFLLKAACPTVQALQLIGKKMLEDFEQQAVKKETKDALLTAFSHAFWRLLDHLIQQELEQCVLPKTEDILSPLLQAMQKKGLVLEQLAEGWQGEALGELFGYRTADRVCRYQEWIRRP